MLIEELGMKDTVHKYDNIIIGSTLEAMMYSYMTNYPIFFAGLRRPKEFEYLGPALPFHLLKSEIKLIRSTNGSFEVGERKDIFWDNLMMCLSYAGLVPITQEVSIRYDGEFVRIVKDNRLIKIKPKTIHLFDDLGVEGLMPPTKTRGKFFSYEWMVFNSLYPHEYDLILSEESPIQQLWFIDPRDKKRLKDGCIVSHFDSLQQMHEELTQFALIFKLKDIFKKYGIKGKANGVYHMDKSVQRYKQVRYTIVDNEVTAPKNIYESIDNIIFHDYSIESLVDQLSPNPKVDYIWKNLFAI